MLTAKVNNWNTEWSPLQSGGCGSMSCMRTGLGLYNAYGFLIDTVTDAQLHLVPQYIYLISNMWETLSSL